MSGIGRYLREIIRECPIDSDRLVLLCNARKQSDWLLEVFPNARIVMCDVKIYSLREQIVIPWLMRSVDVYWSPHYNAPLLMLARLVVTVHDLAHLALPDIFGRGVKRAYAYVIMHCIACIAEEIIFISKFTQTEFFRLIGPVSGQLSIVWNGASSDFSVLSPMALRGSDFLFVGNVKPHKNLLRLVKAYSKYAVRHTSRLLIVGNKSGFFSGLTASELSELTVTQGVSFLGEVSDVCLKDLYATAKAFVFPSYYEGYGLPPLEAMLAGCPVIVSNVSALPEVCGAPFDRHSGAGNVLYFDPFSVDAIHNALERLDGLSLGHLESMGKNARMHALSRSWKDSASSTWGLFRKLGLK